MTSTSWTAWHVRTLASATALGLLLVGCGGEDADEDADDADDQETVAADQQDSGDDGESDDDTDGEADTDEPVPASSDGPAENWPEPEKPDAMFEETEEGAIAALEYWFEARTYARNTGDTTTLEAQSSDECLVCEDQLDHLDEAFASGVWYHQEDDVISNVHSELHESDLVVLSFVLDSGSFEVFDDSGLVEAVEGSSGESWEADLVFQDEWRVRELEHMENGDSS